jgi:uncharacterized protein YukE
MTSAGTIKAETAALQTAAGMIAVAGGTMQDAVGRVDAATSVGSGAFGGEPAGAAFDSMAGRASDALQSIANVLGDLATNTAAAAQGYIVTDQGAIPSSLRIAHSSEFPPPPP